MATITKDDLKTHLYPEIIDTITRVDDTLVTTAISNAESEAKSYLMRFDTANMFIPLFTNEWFKCIIKDLACWHLIKLANPNIDLKLFRTSYEDAIRYLKQVMKGEVDPGWPLRPDDPTTPFDESGNIYASSFPKRTNNF